MLASRFLGLWRLIPDLCKYDVGQAPIKATYSFVINQTTTSIIDVGIDWTDVHGKDANVKYQIQLGVKKVEKFHGLDVIVLHELTEKGMLNSSVWHQANQKLLMKSYRQLKDNDQKLQVLMETPTETGVNRIFQVYEKVQ